MASRAAPGDLETVRAFINTNDIEAGTDAIGNPAALQSWLTERGLSSENAPVDAAGLSRALRLREALRALALANGGHELEPGAVDDLNALAADLPLAMTFAADGSAALAPRADGLDGALSSLLGIVYRAMAGGTWSRLKACRNDSCLWAFYDISKNRSATWCTMAVCGNRQKVRAYQQRRRGTVGKAAGPRTPEGGRFS